MHPVLALVLLAVAGLLVTRLSTVRSRQSPYLDRAVAAGVPLVLLGLVLGPGIALLQRSLLHGIAPLTLLATGWIGAGLGARCEWRAVRRVPRRAWLLAAVSAAAVSGAVALGAWLLARRVPGLGAAWATPASAWLGLAAVAAVAAPGVITRLAQLLGAPRTLSRAVARFAALETSCGILAMSVALAVARPHLGGNPAVAWLRWVAVASGGAALVALVFLGLTRLRPGGAELGAALLGALLLGAGIGYATGVSPLAVCALAAVAIVNVAPRRRQAQLVLARGEQASYALILMVVGALLSLPTLWILLAGPLLGALRAGSSWASVYYARGPLPLSPLPPRAGLATVAQGGVAVALGINYIMVASGWLDSPGGASGATPGSGVLTTIVLGIALSQLATPTLLRLALGAGPARLTPAPASPELTTNAPAD